MRDRYPRQAANVMVNAEVTLEELFNGTTRTMKLQKRKVVDKRLVVEVKPLEVGTSRSSHIDKAAVHGQTCIPARRSVWLLPC